MVCGAAPTPSASGRSADPIGFRFWCSGRIVSPHTPPHQRHNRGIMRKSPSASGVPARTILPERHIPPRAGSAGAFSASWGRATPVEASAAAMLRARTRSARPAAPAAAVRGVDGAGKGGRRVTFGGATALARSGNGVIAPLRDGRSAGRKVKDTRRPPFWVAGPPARRFTRIHDETDGAEEASGTAIPRAAAPAGPSAPASATPFSLCYAP